MIFSFKTRETEDIFDGIDSKRARKVCPKNLWSIAQRKLDLLNAAVSLGDLKVPLGNNLEALKGDRKGGVVQKRVTVLPNINLSSRTFALNSHQL